MKAFTNSELSAFCGQLSLILQSGISSFEGISLMLEDLPKGETRDLLTDILHQMEDGTPLHDALLSSGAFPSYLCSMAEVGEQSGRLDDVMEGLANHYRREEALAGNIRSAVSYPLIMLGMMAVVLIVLVVRVLPVFQEVFEQLGAGMTGISASLLRFGERISDYGTVFAVIIVLLALIFCWAYFTSAGRKRAAALFRNFFLSRRFAEKVACSRFAGAMYLALSSGLEVDQGLELSERLVEHPGVREKIRRIRELTAEGQSFTEAVSDSRIFSGLYTRMLSLGFKTGSMDSVMKQIADRYDEEIEDRLTTVVSRLEPTLVAVLSILAGMILLSVMLPLLGIMSNIG